MGMTTRAQVPFLSRGMTEKTPGLQGLINPLTLKSQSRGNHIRRAGNSGEKLPRNDSQRVTSTAIQMHGILEKAKLWRGKKISNCQGMVGEWGGEEGTHIWSIEDF